MRYLLAILLMLGVSYGQTIYVTDQNIFDLVPDRDALTGLAGSQRIKASFWEDPSYTSPLDLTAGLPIQLIVKSTVDDYTVSIPNSITSTPPNTVWWVVPALNAGSYRLQASYVDTIDTFPVFDRYLTLTSAVSAASVVNISATNNISADVNITNITQSSLNIYYWGTNVASVTNSP